MVKRVPFSIPKEPPAEVMRISTRSDATFTEALLRKMYQYFTSARRGQTHMLPRNLVRRTIEAEISDLCQGALVFPVFRLEHRKAKFVRCCYSSVWRRLLG